MSAISSLGPKEGLIKNFNEFLGRKNSTSGKNLMSYNLVYNALERLKSDNYNIKDKHIWKMTARQYSRYNKNNRIIEIAQKILNPKLFPYKESIQKKGGPVKNSVTNVVPPVKNIFPPVKNVAPPKQVRQIDLDDNGSSSEFVNGFIKRHPELTSDEVVKMMRKTYHLDIDLVQVQQRQLVQVQQQQNSDLPKKKIDLENKKELPEIIQAFIEQQLHLTADQIANNLKEIYGQEISSQQLQQLLDKQGEAEEGSKIFT